jgi:cation diffusion facilitator family transporter
MDGPAIEQRALRLSTVGYLLMGALGIGFFLVTRSEAILLDGVYSLVSFGASLMASRVARLVREPGSETFHFGYAHFEPLLNTLRSFLIVGLSAFAFVSAIDALLHGGRPISAGLAMVYGISAAVLCLLMAWNQRRLAKKVGSPLLDVDARTWFVDGIISAGAAAAFITAFAFEKLELHDLLPYVDPTLVVLLVLVMAKVPLQALWENLREVLQVAPPAEDQEAVRTAIEGALTNLPTREIQVRMVKVGRTFYVLTHVILPEDWRPASTGALDAIRCRIATSLADVDLQLLTDTVFTADEHWSSFEDDRTCEDSTKA